MEIRSNQYLCATWLIQSEKELFWFEGEGANRVYLVLRSLLQVSQPRDREH
jgi:hypothetical protein